MLVPETHLPDLQEAVVDCAPGDPAPGDRAEQGGDEVQSDIRRAIERARQVAIWLTAIESKSAPFALDGRVVAAMNAGYTQERSIASLVRLESLTAPLALEHGVAAQILRTDPQDREVAPAELDARVEDQVRDPEGAMVRGMAGRLDPISAPSELDERLLRQLDEEAPTTRPTAGPVAGRARSVAAGLALAAGVLLSVWLSDPSATPAAGPVTAEVAHASSLYQARSVVASAAQPGASSSRETTSASGHAFRVQRLTEDTLTPADRAVIQALGLPSGGEG